LIFLLLPKGQGSPQPIITQRNRIKRDQRAEGQYSGTALRERCDLSKREVGVIFSFCIYQIEIKLDKPATQVTTRLIDRDNILAVVWKIRVK
jgi:hypothetical protein